MKFPKQDIKSPFDFERWRSSSGPRDFEGRMLISSDPEKHAPRSSASSTRFDQVYSTTSPQPGRVIEVFGREVLPKLTA